MAGVSAMALPPAAAPLFSLPLWPRPATLIVLIGLGAFFWTRPGASRAAREDGGLLSPAAASHLQSGLAREEMISYLQQSQLMLTDLLQDCAGDDVRPLGDPTCIRARPRNCC